MKYLETMTSSVTSIREKDERFGPAETVFDKTAKLASIKLDKELTPYDIVTILGCLNDARKIKDRLGSEHYVDNVNLEAFALQFAVDAATQKLEDQDKLESDRSAESARQFAPMGTTTTVEDGSHDQAEHHFQA